MYHLCLTGFDVYYWISSTQKPGVKDLFVFLTAACHDASCGGRVQFTVRAGRIEGEKHLVRNPKALKTDEQFPLPNQVQCTNCTHTLLIDGQLAEAISAKAEEFYDGLREQRKAAQAPWN